MHLFYVPRAIVLAGAILNGTGGILRLFSTLPDLNDDMSKEAQYMITLVAQVLIGLANPFGYSLPTKVHMSDIDVRRGPI